MCSWITAVGAGSTNVVTPAELANYNELKRKQQLEPERKTTLAAGADSTAGVRSEVEHLEIDLKTQSARERQLEARQSLLASEYKSLTAKTQDMRCAGAFGPSDLITDPFVAGNHHRISPKTQTRWGCQHAAT